MGQMKIKFGVFIIKVKANPFMSMNSTADKGGVVKKVKKQE